MLGVAVVIVEVDVNDAFNVFCSDDVFVKPRSPKKLIDFLRGSFVCVRIANQSLTGPSKKSLIYNSRTPISVNF